jgi:hypothetical protein
MRCWSFTLSSCRSTTRNPIVSLLYLYTITRRILPWIHNGRDLNDSANQRTSSSQLVSKRLDIPNVASIDKGNSFVFRFNVLHLSKNISHEETISTRISSVFTLVQDLKIESDSTLNSICFSSSFFAALITGTPMFNRYTHCRWILSAIYRPSGKILWEWIVFGRLENAIREHFATASFRGCIH